MNCVRITSQRVEEWGSDKEYQSEDNEGNFQEQRETVQNGKSDQRYE